MILPARLAIFATIIAMPLVVLGCTDSTSAPTNTPVPTATPAQTPTSTPEPTPTPEPAPIDAQAVGDLLAGIPAGYDPVLILDVRSIVNNPVLFDALEEEDILSALGPAAGAVLESTDAFAYALGDTAVLLTLRGPTSVEDLVAAIRGTDEAGVAPESYRDFQIWGFDVEFFITVKMAASAIADDTIALVISLPPTTVSSVDALKIVLDNVATSEPGFASDPVIESMLESLPQGIVMVATKDCASFGQLTSQAADLCGGLAFSVTQEAKDIVLWGVLSFSGAPTAILAVPIVKEEIVRVGSAFEFLKDTEVSRKGNLVLIKARADFSPALSKLVELASSFDR